MNESDVLVVMVTFPDKEVARQIATVLVEKQVASCVNMTQGVESVFRWEGEVTTELEVMALMKTTRETYESLEKLVLELHPYENPEVVALAVEKGSENYLKWVRESCLD